MTLRSSVVDSLELAVPEHLEAAAAAGRKLAVQGPAPGTSAADRMVEAKARAAIPVLGKMGIDAEVVRSRDGCLVVRSACQWPGSSPAACALIRAWLEALPAVVHGVGATVAESTCAARGGRRCLHTLIWRTDSAASSPLALTPPQRQLQPHVQPLAQLQAPSQVTSPLAEPTAANGHTSRTVTTPPPSAPQPPINPQPPTIPQPPATPQAPGERTEGNDPTGSGLRASDFAQAQAQVEGSERDSAGGRGGIRLRGRTSSRWAWLGRRSWLMAVCLVAGSVGGLFASTHGSVSYSATTVLVVQAGASTVATSSANGAEELAVTYAALIPDDEALLRRIAAKTGTSPSEIGHRLSVQAESGTALMEVRFTGSDPAAAVYGANAVASALTSASPPGRAIVPGSVNTVSAARTASRSGTLHKYGLPLGMLLGLAVGVGAALVAERTDRRVDDLDTLGDVAGCSSTVAPGGISPAEMARALARSGDDQITVVALRPRQSDAALTLARSLSAAWPASSSRVDGRPPVVVSPPFEAVPESLTQGSGTTVMVVGSGERLDAVQEAADRFRLLGRSPGWAVLVRGGRIRSFAHHGS